MYRQVKKERNTLRRNNRYICLINPAYPFIHGKMDDGLKAGFYKILYFISIYKVKKNYFGITILVVLFWCVVIADDIITILPNINENSIHDINTIGLRFCNDGLETEKLTKNLYLQAQPGQKKEICTIFYSTSTKKNTQVSVWFSRWNKTSDGNITCDANVSDNIFARMIQKDTNYLFSLSGGEQKIKKFHIILPNTSTGEMYWCISYTLPQNYTKNTWDMFGIVVRKAIPIQITITWDIYKLGWRDDIKDIYRENNILILKCIIAILAIYIIISMFQPTKKKK